MRIGSARVAVAEETETDRFAREAPAAQPRGADRSPGLPEGWVLAGILVVAAGLRLLRLDGQSLWLDEVLSVARGQTLLTDGLGTQLFNGHGPLFFYLVAAVLPLDPGEFMLRLPSVLFGVVAVAVMYPLGKEFLGRRGGLLAAAVTAVSPFAIWYSQEARYISLFMLLVALSILFFHRFQRGGSRSALGLYVLSTTLMLLSFVGGVFLVLAQNLWMAGARGPRATLRRWVVGQLLVAAVFLPWFVHAYAIDIDPLPDSEAENRSFSLADWSAGFKRSKEPIQIGYVFLAYGVGYSFGPSTQELHREPSLQAVRAKAVEVVAAVALIAAVGVAGILYAWRRSRRDAVLLAACVLIPVLGAFAVASLTSIAFNVRYTSAAFPAYMLFLTAGLLWWKDRSRWGWVVVAGVLAILAISVANHYGNPEYFKEDSRGVARLLEDVRRPGERLLVGTTVIPLQYYYGGPLQRWNSVRLVRQPAAGAGSGPDRVWLVATRTWQSPEFRAFVERMSRCYPMERRYVLPGYVVAAYEVSPGSGPAACTLQDAPQQAERQNS